MTTEKQVAYPTVRYANILIMAITAPPLLGFSKVIASKQAFIASLGLKIWSTKVGRKSDKSDKIIPCVRLTRRTQQLDRGLSLSESESTWYLASD